jgi:transposase
MVLETVFTRKMLPENVKQKPSTMKLYLGGDVSKGYTDWVILSEKKLKVLENFQLDDTYAGHCKLYSALEAYFDKHAGLEMYAALESTGGYENNWYNTLKSYQKVFNLKVARINPLGVNYNRRAGMKRNVTDAISAVSIAEYMINHPDNITYDQDEKWKTLCRHWNFVEMQKKQRIQTINQLETILYCSNPALLRFKKDNLPNWLLELIIMCPTADKLAKARPENLSKIPYLTLNRSKELVAEAKQNIASATDRNAELLVSQIAIQIKAFDENIKSQMKLIEQEMSCPEIEVLKSFKGIDTTSAIGLMLEIKAVERFPAVKGISCYFGLHPKFKQSGDKVIGVRMSKQGSKNMRKILFNIAKGAITYNPLITEIYEKKLSEGMSKMAAIGVCMHKILRIIYGMLKNHQPYNPAIDKQNWERSKSKQQEKLMQENANIQKNRRYQEFDATAPISKKQTKKRKEHDLSQCEITSQSTGSTCSSITKLQNVENNKLKITS